MTRPTYAERGGADLRLMGRILLAHAWVLLAGTLDGCGHVAASGPLWPDPFPQVIFEDVSLPEGTPESEVVVRDDGTVIWCASLDEADYLREVDQVYPLCRDALRLAYEGRTDDREYAETVLAARETQLSRAREGQGRAFVWGAGAGGGGVVLAVLVAVLLTR